MFNTRGIALAPHGAVLFSVYQRVYRPWHSRWGATDEEVALAISGDECIERPTFKMREV
jgi:hypothetical protein